jgi:8-oxo-dGTP diphosphatase
VEKFYGKSGLDSVGARRNPEEYQEDYMVPRDIHRLGKAADRLEDTYEDGQEVPEWWKSKLSVAAKDTDTLADALEYVDERGNPGEDALTVFTGEPNGQFANKGMVTAEVQIGRGIMKDIGEGIQDIYRGIIGGRQSMTEKRMAMAVATMHKELSDRAKAKGANAVANLQIDYEYPTQGDLTLMATADAIKMSSPPKQNPLPLMGLSVQVSGYRNAAGAFVMKGKKFLILQRSTKETSKHGLWELPGGKVEKGETPRETAVIEVKEEAGLDIKLKANLGPHHDDKMKKTYHAYVAVPKKGQRVKLSEEHSDYKWVTPEEVMAMPNKMVSHHLRYFLKKESETIRNNPANPSKVEKGKKLYKHMNGKDPEKIETKKIDMGDVWYQVGEGGCWQIGYMSGKETGSSSQKYTHTFNEETKDGNFPKLYATMPENGKPMLIITGGTWKIKTDDTGTAWIYD